VPELPEVETTRRAVADLVGGKRLIGALIRDGRLRWPVSPELPRLVAGCSIREVGRRGKYLLLKLDRGTLLIHLGMSGSLRLVDADSPAGPHDHLDLLVEGGGCLRLRDPRRFGALLWIQANPLDHPLLAKLGPEPLEDGFDGDWLYRVSRGKRRAIKNFIMDAQVLVGVGNIYASEALFQAGIRPQRMASRLSRNACGRLTEAIREVLRAAIAQGGTTLRDFQHSEGRPGYFAQQLAVYGRTGEPCRTCQTPIEAVRIGQRSSFYCPRCQK